ncbi:DUF5671 domain-containing protein [Candidatus Binatus soli]|jgi:hypothetical protein|uniref:DUF5671 domain-containing protein n=1 Tax=Candidatus Binatus soli TaxID=1953413 RepID=UPI003D14CA9C
MNDEAAKSSPWDVFIHLLAVIALYISVSGAITLLFQFIDLALPDPLDRGTDVLDNIRYGVSMVIVFFPAYWWAWRAIEIDLASNPKKRRLWVRTCPIYLTLFLAGLLALGDLVCLLYYLMSGDLTSRFLLKVIAVLVVAGGVLVFYRNALGREPGPLPAAMRAFAYAAAALAGALVIGGFIAAGPPMRARLVRLDQQRLQDLDAVQAKIVQYWQAKSELPASLDQLKDDIEGYSPQRDPVSGDSYGYQRTGPTSFELCANFALKDSDVEHNLPPFPMMGTSTAWNHEAGHYCFPRTVDPALHPARKFRSS